MDDDFDNIDEITKIPFFRTKGICCSVSIFCILKENNDFLSLMEQYLTMLNWSIEIKKSKTGHANNDITGIEWDDILPTFFIVASDQILTEESLPHVISISSSIIEAHIIDEF